ncbi:unnamed protein product [Ambrosiozyma monospora]|uniref:Unnamed protein product n=1 Tax=Ambrosiozyma monospora TaxID=43982 RepID=A0ACB5U7Z6_AMBMO|nr:unnamed protein product [Ambrosiozyma monospora]
MAPVHSKISKRHKTIIRQRSGENQLRMAQKNVDLVLYLNYLRFLNGLIKKSYEASEKDASFEVLPKHLTDAKAEMLKRFRG